jgi:hypothetical protein
MLREYAALPLTAPSQCFVCTAAAKGHPRVVRSKEYLDPQGMAFRVNDQLRFLKGIELLLASFSPRLHRVCRSIYDRVGPRLAGMMVHPALADLGYLVLKPAEWAARICLAFAIPGETELVRNIYRTRPRSEGAKQSMRVTPHIAVPQMEAERPQPGGEMAGTNGGDGVRVGNLLTPPS